MKYLNQIRNKYLRLKYNIKYKKHPSLWDVMNFEFSFFSGWLITSSFIIFLFIELQIYSDINLLFFILEKDYTIVLKILISISAFIVPIILTFIVSQFSNLRQDQKVKAQELGKMQNRLNLLRRAVQGLGSELLGKARGNNIEIDFNRNYKDMIRDISFWEEEHSYLIFFIRTLWAISEDCFSEEEFEKSQKFFIYKEIKELLDNSIQIWAVLDREKHYKYIFNPLGIDYTGGFDNTRVCSSRVRIYIPKDLMPPEQEKILNVSFWKDLFEELIDLLEKMTPVYQLLLKRIPRKLSDYMIILSIFGIFLPLLLLFFNLKLEIEFFVTYYSAIIFLIFLALSLIDIIKKVTSGFLVKII